MWVCMCVVEVFEYAGWEELVRELEGMDEWPDLVYDIGDGLVVF